jgi:hypothetical protein
VQFEWRHVGSLREALAGVDEQVQSFVFADSGEVADDAGSLGAQA